MTGVRSAAHESRRSDGRPLAIPPRDARCAQPEIRRDSLFSPCVSDWSQLRSSAVNPVASVSFVVFGHSPARGTIRGSPRTSEPFHALRDFDTPLSRSPARTRASRADRGGGVRDDRALRDAKPLRLPRRRGSRGPEPLAHRDRADAQQRPCADHGRLWRPRTEDDVLERGRRERPPRGRCSRNRSSAGNRKDDSVRHPGPAPRYADRHEPPGRQSPRRSAAEPR